MGQVDLRETAPNPADLRILWTDDGGQQFGWQDAASFTYLSGPEQTDELREVDWAGDMDWWSAGSRGLILRSTDHGQNWIQFKPASFTLADFQKFEWNSVSFQDQSSGIFVGWHRPTNTRAAFQYRVSGGQTTWTDIKPSNATRLTGVDVAGNVAYAVGWEVVGGVREGRIFQSTSSGGVFGTFTQVPGHPIITACVVGEDLDRIGVFEEVEIIPATGDVAVGGECSNLVYWTASTGQWTVEKSQTDAHIQGLSATPSGVVFTACHRQAEPSQSVTRFQR